MSDDQEFIRTNGFVPTHLEEEQRDKPDTFTVRLSFQERNDFNELKKIIEQERDSTALKQLAWIGAKVLQSDLQSQILAVLFKNKRNNKRQGITDFD